MKKGIKRNGQWSFIKISKRYKRDNQDVYMLTDILGDPISGTYYKYELQKIDNADIELYKVDKSWKKEKWKENNPKY